LRVYYSPDGDPMLQDSPGGLADLHAAITAFLDSPNERVAIDAVTTGSPAPYQELLRGLRVAKGNGLRLSISDDRWLELEVSANSIGEFMQAVSPGAGTGHRHCYTTPVSLIVEPIDEAGI
jgi:hypothetical protein